MSDDVVARAKLALVGVTDGPWSWTSPRYGVPTLEGRAGDPELYRYDTEVLEADHHGECGCRSACELELTVSDADKAFIAAARGLVPELVAEVERLRGDRYDWMAAELVVLAGEMSGGEGFLGAQLDLVRSAMLGVAEYVSKLKGSGAVSARLLLGGVDS